MYEGVASPVKMIWNLTGRGLYDPRGAARSWSDLGKGMSIIHTAFISANSSINIAPLNRVNTAAILRLSRKCLTPITIKRTRKQCTYKYTHSRTNIHIF